MREPVGQSVQVTGKRGKLSDIVRITAGRNRYEMTGSTDVNSSSMQVQMLQVVW